MRKLLLLGVVGGLLLPVGLAVGAEGDLGPLLEALKSDDDAACREAIHTLAVMGDEAAGATPALVEILKDDSAAVRAHAAQALGGIGPAAKEAAPALVELVGDADPKVRGAAVTALKGIRPGPEVMVPLLGRLMRDSSDAVRIRAMDALAEVGEEALPLLIESLKDEETVYWACLVLAEVGPEAESAVPALTEALKSERPEVQREAAIALGHIGPGAAAAAAALSAMLDHEINRIPATFALAAIGPAAKSAEPLIKQNAQSTDPMLRNVSQWALVKLNPDDQELLKTTINMLAASLTDQNDMVREGAVRGLADLDPGPELMRPAFLAAIEGADEETVSKALDAIVAFGDLEVPRLIEALKYEDLRPKIVSILSRMGPEAAPALPALVELLEDEEEAVRHEVLFALARIGPAAKDAVPGLVKMLQEGDLPAKQGAAYALGKIGADATAAKPHLLEACQGDDEMVCLVCAWALVMVDPDCQESCLKTVPVLIQGLGMPESLARLEASAALGRLGPLAEPAVETLQQLAENDGDPLVREAAADALEQIQEGAAGAIKPGDSVVVAADGVNLKRGRDVIAQPPKGATVKVLQLKDDWVGVQWEADGETKKGWVKSSQVQKP